MTRLYRSVYPIAALVILAFEAWAVIVRLMESGLKTTEYVFILIWVLAAVGSILLLTMRGAGAWKLTGHWLLSPACLL